MIRGISPVIPSPRKAAVSEKVITVPASVVCPPDVMPAAEAFASYMRASGIEVTVRAEDEPFADVTGPDAEGSVARGIVALRVSGAEQESYTIEARNGSAVVKASGFRGFCRAFASLWQASEASGNGFVNLHYKMIDDGPENGYRGLMVDLARFRHPFGYLKAYVELCWAYKLSVLHLHFTDDQSYTLPSRILPKLSTPGRSYSPEEIAELTEYAAARGVDIMPEIDVPGHNACFSAAYPELFGTRGIICQHEDSVNKIAELFDELCRMFPRSTMIHVGGDEANLKNWLDCPECMKYAKKTGALKDGDTDTDVCDRLYVDFIVKMAETVRKNGKKPVVWEGFPKSMNGSVPRYITVMSWENYYQITPDLLEAGFDIINCSWNPMYIVAPDVKWTPEEICSWSIYRWIPVHPGSPFSGSSYECEPSGQVKGGQLLAWGDRLPAAFHDDDEGSRAELGLILDRIPYLAQNTWHKSERLVYNETAEAVSELKRKVAALISRNIDK